MLLDGAALGASAEPEWDGLIAASGIVFGGIGAQTGVLVDASINHDEIEVLYRAK